MSPRTPVLDPALHGVAEAVDDGVAEGVGVGCTTVPEVTVSVVVTDLAA